MNEVREIGGYMSEREEKHRERKSPQLFPWFFNDYGGRGGEYQEVKELEGALGKTIPSWNPLSNLDTSSPKVYSSHSLKSLT